MTRVKRKPLVERVEWDEPVPMWWSLDLAGLSVEVRPNAHGVYRMRSVIPWEQSSWKILEASTAEAAKAEALRIVQSAVLAAAAEWAD